MKAGIAFTISTNSDEEFHCIFNNKGNGKQTDNIDLRKMVLK